MEWLRNAARWAWRQLNAAADWIADKINGDESTPSAPTSADPGPLTGRTPAEEAVIAIARQGGYDPTTLAEAMAQAQHFAEQAGATLQALRNIGYAGTTLDRAPEYIHRYAVGSQERLANLSDRETQITDLKGRNTLLTNRVAQLEGENISLQRELTQSLTKVFDTSKRDDALDKLVETSIEDKQELALLRADPAALKGMPFALLRLSRAVQVVLEESPDSIKHGARKCLTEANRVAFPFIENVKFSRKWKNPETWDTTKWPENQLPATPPPAPPRDNDRDRGGSRRGRDRSRDNQDDRPNA